MKTINCTVCGVSVLVSIYGPSKYCKDCRVKVKKENAKVYSRLHYSRAKRKRKNSNTKEIIEISNEATKLGISYGKYVAGTYKKR